MIVTAAPTDQDALRLRSEFLELPGLAITVPQAARMLGLRSEHAAAILETLANEKFLTQTSAGYYRRTVSPHRIGH